MYSVRHVTETFIRMVQADVNEGAVLVPPDDAFEVTATPSLLIQGPRFTENKARRSMARQVMTDTDALTFEDREYPRFYHLDFDVIATTTKEADLIDLVATVIAFFAFHREIEIPPDGDALAITELTSMGGLNRVNLSNLKQSSGRYRIEDCTVYGGEAVHGKLIVDRIFDYDGPTLTESRTHEPPST